MERQIIYRGQIDDDYARDETPYVLGCVSDDGGPLLYVYGAEEEQAAFAATCENLNRVLREPSYPSRAAELPADSFASGLI